MTTRTLFNIILKIIGILFFTEFFIALINFIAISSDFSDRSFQEVFWTHFPTFIMLIVYGFLFYCFIFKTNAVVDMLRLDKDFEQQSLSLNIPITTILSISIFVIGGLLVAREAPNFVRQLVLYIQQRKLYPAPHGGISDVIVSLARLLIGLLMIGYQKQMVEYIQRKQKPA